MLKIPHDGIYGKPKKTLHSLIRKAQRESYFFLFFGSSIIKFITRIKLMILFSFILLNINYYLLTESMAIPLFDWTNLQATFRRAFGRLHRHSKAFENVLLKIEGIFVKFITTPKKMINKILITFLRKPRSFPPTRIPTELIMQTWAKWNPLNIGRYVQK